MSERSKQRHGADAPLRGPQVILSVHQTYADEQRGDHGAIDSRHWAVDHGVTLRRRFGTPCLTITCLLG